MHYVRAALTAPTRSASSQAIVQMQFYTAQLKPYICRNVELRLQEVVLGAAAASGAVLQKEARVAKALAKLDAVRRHDVRFPTTQSVNDIQYHRFPQRRSPGAAF
ncbi:hypothetical protein E4K72_03510 [Oxalobacteraceae bacterium OM1]|nr:hypothetical protein E4K72_03510 [Oxalobacteraceae bacterium OM1]